MPSLEESFPTLLQLHSSRDEPGAQVLSREDAFQSLLAAVLSRASEEARSATLVESFRNAGLSGPEALAAAEPIEVLDALRETGVKLPAKTANVLTRLARWFSSRFPERGEVDLEAVSTSQLRDDLVSLTGVGLATADAILLFALGRPAYPVDRGTYRILVRHGWIDTSADYDEVSQLLVRLARERPDNLARLSRGLVQVARQHCRVGSPRCMHCPLRSVLPEQGPLEPDS
jgi:endonuclease-3 related protein